MRTLPTKRFDRSYDSAPAPIKRAFVKQAAFLLTDIRHLSLRAKKYDEANNIWQARVNRDWRFYFRIKGDTYILLEILAHPK
jgi:plasmid maintenance system killer protein